MLDKWFIEDIHEGLKIANRFVIIDEQKKCEFLLHILKNAKMGTIFEVYSELDELHSKYEIEKSYSDKNVIIFTTTALADLKFLREYCETSGCLRISHLHRYIKQKINEKMGFDLNLSEEEIIAIGKISIGKGKDYWDRVKERGREGVFTLYDILDFLSGPIKTFRALGKEEQKLFTDYVSQYLAYPLEKKPPQTMADEIAIAIFDDIANQKKKPFFEKLYQSWINSKKHESALRKHLDKYSFPPDVDIWDLQNSHPFASVDRQWLGEIVEHIDERSWLDQRLPLIKERSQQAITEFLNAGYWKDIYTLFSYDISEIDDIRDLDGLIEHYKKNFYAIDNSIRHLYNHFMAEKSVLKPIQEYYQKIVLLYLNKWFEYFPKQYSENQTGLLKNIIKENEHPVAIIVGDAISFEIAQEIVQGIGSEFKIQNNVICGNFPSETENNMSSLFVSSGKLFASPQLREKALLKDTGKEIKFTSLDDLSVAHEQQDYSIFYSRDVDELSEKQKQNALKYYNEFIKSVQEKVNILFSCGYKKVFLVSDHGFVLAGILEEVDKIQLDVKDGEKFVRYCVTKGKLSSTPEHIIAMPKKYKGYSNIYFSRTLNPFKTKGAYGFSHGGITPQELLVPYIKIEKVPGPENMLEVSVANKDDLIAVIGDLYQIKIKAGQQAEDIFSNQRKIMIIFVKEKKQFNQSDIIQVKADKEVEREFAFEQHDDFEIIVIDAETKTRLDSCKVKKYKARDLGGLGGKK